MMKLAKIAGAILAACLISLPASAEEPSNYTGVVSMWVGYTFADIDDELEPFCDGCGGYGADLDMARHPMLGGNARVGFDLPNSWYTQIDIDGEVSLLDLGSEHDDECCGNYDENYGSSFFISGHLTSDRSKDTAMGAFTSIGVASAGEDENASVYVVGVEAMHHREKVTVYGQGGWFTTKAEGRDCCGDDGIENAIFVRGVLRLFPDPDSRFDVDLTYANGDVNYDDNQDICCGEIPTGDSDSMWAIGLGYEKQMNDGPISWFVGYRWSKTISEDRRSRWIGPDECCDGYKVFDTSVSDHTIMTGFKFRFGGGSLQDFNSTGASLDTPWAIGRWTGYAIESLD